MSVYWGKKRWNLFPENYFCGTGVDQVLLYSLVLAKDKKSINPLYTVWTAAYFSYDSNKKANGGKERIYWISIFCLKHKRAHFGKGYKKELLINDNLLLNGFWKFLVSIWAKFNLLNTQLLSLLL